jgi:hypothetical protein
MPMVRLSNEALKPETDRKDVKDYLRANGASYHQMCCVGERSTFADLLEIRKEEHPSYCSENKVYIEFQFAEVKPRAGVFHLDDSDVLTKITTFHQSEGSL